MNIQETEMESRHRTFCRRAAAEGMVLLKNEDKVLPVAKGRRIALYGGGALYTVKGGTGSGEVNSRQAVSILQGLTDAGYNIITQGWLDDCRGKYDEARKIRPEEIPEWDRKNSPAFYVISRISGEGADRRAEKGDYYLSDIEREELENICGIFSKVVVILNVGGIIDLNFVDELKIKGVVLMSLAGMEGGNALADIVSGKIDPSGRLTDTWAEKYMDYPSSAEFGSNSSNEYYTDGIYVGYRYFDSFKVKPRYPFGYGLSYTSFSFKYPEAVSLDGKTVNVKVDVTNTGRMVGREVVQLYVSCPWGLRKKEQKRLVAFGKTKPLFPGRNQRITLSFDLEQLLSYHTGRASWFLEAGKYLLLAGTSSDNVTAIGVLGLKETVWMAKGDNICPLQDALCEIEPEKDMLDYLRSEAFIFRQETDDEEEEQPVKAAAKIMDAGPVSIDDAARELQEAWTERKKNLAGRVDNLDEINERFAAMEFAEDESTRQLSLIKEEPIISVPEENGVFRDARGLVSYLTLREKAAVVCGEYEEGSSASIDVPGAAAVTTEILGAKGIGQIVLADGPAGLRLSRHCSQLPMATLLAQTFDEAMMESAGEMIAEEMKEAGVAVWLAPAMNIHRNPLCGRNFEYYSEDPLVSGRMAAAITKGVQNDSSLSVTIKHFACNNQEDNRMGISAVVSERALREIYLKGFEIAVRTAHPHCIMTSYNKINGVHSANNYDLCTLTARQDWGFDGLIMTDWTTTNEGGGSSAAKCIAAGNDLIMPGRLSDVKEIMDAVEQTGDLSLSENLLDQSVERVLRLIMASKQ